MHTVALHGLSLAVSRKMIWPTALVTCCCAVVASEAAATGASKGPACRRSTSATADGSDWGCVGSWAVTLRLSVSELFREAARVSAYGKMSGLTARVALSASASSTAQAKSRAVCLDVAEALAMVALLCWICCERRLIMCYC